MAQAKAKAARAKSKVATRATTVPFAFFGAGDASYFEQATLTVVFVEPPSAAAKRQIEDAIPPPLQRSQWTKRTLIVATDDHALASERSFTAFNAAIECWLHDCHAISRIDFALRAEDSEAGTQFSSWHTDSMAGALALVSSLASRYDHADGRKHVKVTLLAMMKAAGITIPGKLDPTRKWRPALDAGDAKAFGPLMARHATDLQLVLDPKNANHRRAVLGSRPKLDRHGKLDVKIFQMGVLDDSDDGRRVIDLFVERAARKPFWSTACSAAAAEYVEDAPDDVLAVLDRLVALENAHPVVVEQALWSVVKIGPDTVARERLERYWAIAVDRLADWEDLRPYLVKIAPVLGRDPPAARRRRSPAP